MIKLKKSLCVCFILTSTMCMGGQFVSDDFSEGLDNAIWQFIDPLGDCQVRVQNKKIVLEVPQGVSHDVWTSGNKACRIVQQVDNSDFVVVVKFTSRCQFKYQMQGILVQEDEVNFLRFDVHHNGKDDRAFAADFRNGNPSMLINEGIAPGDCYFLKITRAGDLFKYFISYNGWNWIFINENERVLDIRSIAIFASNHGIDTIPAFTCEIDYAFNAAAPIFPEDDEQELYGIMFEKTGMGRIVAQPGACTCSPSMVLPPIGDLSGDCKTDLTDFALFGADWFLNEQCQADFNKDKVVNHADMMDLVSNWLSDSMPSDCGDPNRSNYYPGQEVTLTAVPDAGWIFAKWGTDVNDNRNPIVIAVNRPTTISVKFVPADTNGPVIEHISVLPRAEAASVYIKTDEDARIVLSYGSDTSYGSGNINDSNLANTHIFNLHSLEPATSYIFRVSAEDACGNQTVFTSSFTTKTENINIVSDDFSLPEINYALWHFIDPIGDSSVSLVQDCAVITVPGGVHHDIWSNRNRAPRLLQEVGNIDLDFQAKFKSTVEQKYQMQGLLAQYDTDNFIRYDIYSDGANLFLFGATFVGGMPYSVLNERITAQAPYYLRMRRIQNQWDLLYSHDGINWASKVHFQHEIEIRSVGFYAGNTGTGSIPAFTSVIDYFFDSNSPVVSEDGDEYHVNLEVVGKGRILKNPDHQTYSAGSVVELTAVSDANYFFAGWEGAINSMENPVTIIVNDETSISARFESVADQLAIDLWHHPESDAGLNGIPQRWVNILGNVRHSSGLTGLAYKLNGSESKPLSIGPGNPRLVNAGDFNVEIDFSELLGGRNEIEICALSKTGESITKTAVVNMHQGSTCTLPYHVNWETSASIHSAAAVVDGKWIIADSGVRVLEPGYDRLIAVGDVNWTDYEITVPVVVHSTYYTPGQYGGRPGFGLVLRWTGHTQWGAEQPNTGWWPLGAYACYSWTTSQSGSYKMIGNRGSYIAYGPSEKIEYGKKYMLKMRVTTNIGIGGVYQFKAWPADQAEPAGWLMHAQEDMSDPQKGSAVLAAHYADVTFGNVTIIPVSE